MLLSLVLHTYSMRYVLPAAVMMGTAPTYILAWGAWRLLSAVLPARFYREVDDRLYTIYQSMVLFFFENYTGVQVSRVGRAPRGPLGSGHRWCRPRSSGLLPAGAHPLCLFSGRGAGRGGSARRARSPPCRVGAEEQVWAVAFLTPGRRGLRARWGRSRFTAAVAPPVMLFMGCRCCLRFAGWKDGRDCDIGRALSALNGSLPGTPEHGGLCCTYVVLN